MYHINVNYMLNYNFIKSYFFSFFDYIVIEVLLGMGIHIGRENRVEAIFTDRNVLLFHSYECTGYLSCLFSFLKLLRVRGDVILIARCQERGRQLF